MVIPEHLATLELRGGHLALDFANTLEGVRGEPPGTDHLAGYAELAAWSAHAGVLAHGDADALARRAAGEPGAARDALRAAKALRAAVYEAFAALAEGRAAPAGALSVLGRAHTRATAAAALAPGEDGRLRWTWDGGALDRPTWAVAVAAIDLLRSPELARLGACDQCNWLFLDRSRNRSRRWCSMRECGAQVKMRRYRAAHRV